MDLTAVANLALSHLGEPFLADYASATGTTAEAVRLHLPMARATVLEGHVWSFATRCSRLARVPNQETKATAILDPAGDNNSIALAAVPGGPSGNGISVAIDSAMPAGSLVEVSGTAITIHPAKARMIVEGTTSPDFNTVLHYQRHFEGRPFYASSSEVTYAENGFGSMLNGVTLDCYALRLWQNGVVVGLWGSYDLEPPASPDLIVNWVPDTTESGSLTITAAAATASQVVAAINRHPAASLLVVASNPSTSAGTGELAPVPATSLAGGTSTSSVFVPSWGSVWMLPPDCLRLLTIDGQSIDAPLARFDILGRNLVLEDSTAEAPVIHYITREPDPQDWPHTFVDAVALLLASRLAPLLSDDQQLASALAVRHEQALGKARSKDARETRSAENHGPRQLLARSPLVAARYRASLSPLAPAGSASSEPTGPDLDAAFESEL